MSRFSRIDWTGSDYDSLLTELRARIAATFPDWTDTSIANEGMALIEVVAHLGDLIRYYQDRQVNEAFLATAWTRVEHFLSSAAADKHYVVEVDAFEKATVIFGDGVNGFQPANGSAVVAKYRISGGAVGNVDADTIKRLGRTFTTASGISVKLTVTNPAKASAGEDREDEAHAKLYGPKSLATGKRSVAAEDYQVNDETVAGVARALAQTSDDDALIPERSVYLQVVPDGSGTPTQSLLDNVTMQLTDKDKTPRTLTVNLLVMP